MEQSIIRTSKHASQGGFRVQSPSVCAQRSRDYRVQSSNDATKRLPRFVILSETKNPVIILRCASTVPFFFATQKKTGNIQKRLAEYHTRQGVMLSKRAMRTPAKHPVIKMSSALPTLYYWILRFTQNDKKE